MSVIKDEVPPNKNHVFSAGKKGSKVRGFEGLGRQYAFVWYEVVEIIMFIVVVELG